MNTAQSEDELRRLNRAYRALCLCSTHVVRATSETELADLLCKTLVDVGGYRFAWVGLPDEDHPASIRHIAAAGTDDGYLDEIRAAWSEDDAQRGPTKAAMRTGVPTINRDSRSNPDYAPWREQALRRGFQSSIAVPLISDGVVIGALSLYAAEPDAFDTDECELLVHFADGLAFGISTLRTRQKLDLRDEQLRQAARVDALGQIAGGVVHDVNNLLQVVTLCGSELLEMLPAEHASRAVAQELLAATRSASSLNQQILAFSRHPEAPPQRVSPGDILTAMAPIVRRAVGSRIAVEISVASDVGLVDISPGQVEQITLNLAVNARDAMPDGGELTIHLTNVDHVPTNAVPVPVGPGPYVELMVRDTGTGMDPALQRRVFEPFFTTKPASGGTGLGLAVVQRIVTQCGGCVAFESASGSGTTFRVFLPNAA